MAGRVVRVMRSTILQKNAPNGSNSSGTTIYSGRVTKVDFCDVCELVESSLAREEDGENLS